MRDESGGKMIRGLCQVHDPWLGPGVKVHEAGGDASPFLTREMYENLRGQPAFEALPAQRQYERLQERMARDNPWQW
jgi:hypothetical protein